MLQLRNYILLTVIFTLAFTSKAGAGLYGFSHSNTQSHEEDVLSFDAPPKKIINYQELMRQNLLMLIDYARAQKPNFQVIAHESPELLTKSLWEYNLEGYNEVRELGDKAKDPTFLDKSINKSAEKAPPIDSSAYQYSTKINAIALNNLFCYPLNEEPLVTSDNTKIISIDYCDSESSFDRAIAQAVKNNTIIYGFTNLNLAFNDVKHQPIINESAKNITQITQAQNILIIDDDSQYANKESFINDLRDTGFDIIIIPTQFHHQIAYTPEEIDSLKFKKNGTQRLLLAQLNVSEADPKDYYWKKSWQLGEPSWLKRPSFSDKTSIITNYWQADWQKIISRHIKDIVRSDFDGVFFTGIENHKYFEKQNPLE